MGLIYLDNAATSWPKPRCTVQAMARALEESGANPGRAGHRLSLEAGRIVERCRQALADMLGETDASRVAFAQNATDALNMAIHGAVRTGDHVVSTLIEHNSVLRPLSELARSGVITLTLVPPAADGRMDAREIERALTARTRLVAMTHTSNVLGLEQDVAAVGAVCRRRGVLFLVDAAQTAGHLPIDFSALHLSALAVPGHKGLLGPGGTGALLLRDELAQRLTPLTAGGTGSASDSEYLPDYLPDKFESGTANLPGYYGWEAALRFVEETGVPALREHEMALCSRFLQGLEDIPHVRLCGTRDLSRRVGVISVDFLRRDNAEAAYALETEYSILTRCGLHCAPSAHRTLGTFPQGTVRFSLGFASTEADVDAALHAIRALA